MRRYRWQKSSLPGLVILSAFMLSLSMLVYSGVIVAQDDPTVDEIAGVVDPSTSMGPLAPQAGASPVLYTQGPPNPSGFAVRSQTIPNSVGFDYVWAADDFVIPTSVRSWTVDHVRVEGGVTDASDPDTIPQVDVYIFPDAGGVPSGAPNNAGSAVYASGALNPANFTQTPTDEFEVPLPSPPTLTPGTYWLVFHVTWNRNTTPTPPGTYGNWLWQLSGSPVTGNTGQVYISSAAAGCAADTWCTLDLIFGTPNVDLAFTLNGTTEPLTGGNLLAVPDTLEIVESDPGTSTFTLSLTDPPNPGETVTANLAFDNTQLTVSPTSVNFDDTNFSAVITVDAIDDATMEPPTALNIDITTTSSLGTPSPFEGLAETVAVTVLDDPLTGGTLQATPDVLDLAEADAPTSTFTLSLSNPPNPGETVDVTLTFDTAQLNVSPSTVSFDDSDFTEIITVEAIDDGLVEGPTSFTITIAATSSLGALSPFEGLSETVTVNVTDTTLTGGMLQATPDVLDLVEADAATGTFTLSLTDAPNVGETVNVMLTFDTTQLNVTPSMVTFDDSDFTETITVEAINDGISEGSTTFSIDIATSSSFGATSPFDGLTETVTVNVDDVTLTGGNLVVDPLTLLVAETGEDGVFTVSLSAPPNAGETVTITFTFDTTQISLSPTTLAFTSTNFAATVTVDAIEDGILEDPTVVLVDVVATSSLGAPSPFNGLTQTVVVTTFNSPDEIIINVPNLGLVELETPADDLLALEEPGGNPIRRPDLSLIILPADFDGNGFDVMQITDYQVDPDGTVWFALWLGSNNYGWIQWNPVTMPVSGEILNLIN